METEKIMSKLWKMVQYRRFLLLYQIWWFYSES